MSDSSSKKAKKQADKETAKRQHDMAGLDSPVPAIPKGDIESVIDQKLLERATEQANSFEISMDKKLDAFATQIRSSISTLAEDIKRDLGATFAADIKKDLGATLAAEIKKDLGATFAADIKKDLEATFAADIKKELGPTLAADIKKDLGASLRTEILAEANQMSAKLAKDHAAAVEDRFRALEGESTALRASRASLQSEVSKLQRRCEDLEKKLTGMENTTPSHDHTVEAEWDDPPNRAIIRVNTSEECELATLRTAVGHWITDWAKLPVEKLALRGPELGRNFTLHFDVAVPLAQQWCKTAVAALRAPDGTWRPFSLISPLEEEIKIFAGAPTSRQTAKEQRIAKQLKGFLESEMDPSQVGAASLRFKRAQRAVSIGWKTVVRVTCPSPNDLWLEWEQAACTKLQITNEQQVDFTRRFKEELAGDEGARSAAGTWKRL